MRWLLHTDRAVSCPSVNFLGKEERAMPWYRITVELSGNVEAESCEAAEAEIQQSIKELALTPEADFAKCEGKLISCVDVGD